MANATSQFSEIHSRLEAMTSASGVALDGMSNYDFTDPADLLAFQQEFNNYNSLISVHSSLTKSLADLCSQIANKL